MVVFARPRAALLPPFGWVVSIFLTGTQVPSSLPSDVGPLPARKLLPES